MSVALWIAVGVTGYLVVALLGLLLCRGIALADRVAMSGPTAPTAMPHPRAAPRSGAGGVSEESRRAVR
ncbi:MAG TPA: hypothetical protein VHE83_12335 [Mycobacteriales bacterium]|nr:hypothetical protein [Mycobacteriales bacterium]